LLLLNGPLKRGGYTFIRRPCCTTTSSMARRSAAAAPRLTTSWATRPAC